MESGQECENSMGPVACYYRHLRFRHRQQKARLQRIEREAVELVGAAGEVDHPDVDVRRMLAQQLRGARIRWSMLVVLTTRRPPGRRRA